MPAAEQRAAQATDCNSNGWGSQTTDLVPASARRQERKQQKHAQPVLKQPRTQLRNDAERISGDRCEGGLLATAATRRPVKKEAEYSRSKPAHADEEEEAHERDLERLQQQPALQE